MPRDTRHLRFNLGVGTAECKAVSGLEKQMGKDVAAGTQGESTPQPTHPVLTLLPGLPHLNTEVCPLQGCRYLRVTGIPPPITAKRPVHARGHRQLGMTADTQLFLPSLCLLPFTPDLFSASPNGLQLPWEAEVTLTAGRL